MKEEKTTPNIGEEEKLNKSIKDLTEELFKGYAAGTKKHPANINISGDASTTADAVMNQVQKAPNDASRDAGRPKQISDVPDKDEDGKRDGKYDKDIASNKDKEDEPDEVKKQSISMDQTQDKHRVKGKPVAPDMRPFTKSEGGETEEELLKKSFVRFQKFVEFETKATEDLKKSSPSEEMVTIPVKEYEGLKKAKASDTSEVLEKSLAIQTQNEILVKSLATLTQKAEEQGVLLAKIAQQPMTPKSITNVSALEKSVGLEGKTEEAFTKSQIGDALVDLVKAGKIPDTAAYEYDMTSSLYNPEHRAIVEKYLQTK